MKHHGNGTVYIAVRCRIDKTRTRLSERRGRDPHERSSVRVSCGCKTRASHLSPSFFTLVPIFPRGGRASSLRRQKPPPSNRLTDVYRHLVSPPRPGITRNTGGIDDARPTRCHKVAGYSSIISRDLYVILDRLKTMLTFKIE